MTTFGPSWAHYRLYLIAVAPIAVVLIALDYVRNRDNAPVFALIVAGTVVVLALYFVLYFRNYRITAELHYLDLRDWLGRTRTLGPDVLDRVVLVTAYTDHVATVPYLMVLDRYGKRVLKLNGRFWSRERMAQLAATLELPVDSLDSAHERDLRHRYPTTR